MKKMLVNKSRKIKISNFSTIIVADTPSTSDKDFWNDHVPWITPKDLSKHTERFIEKRERVSENNQRKYKWVKYKTKKDC